MYIWQLGLGGLSGHDAFASSATHYRVHLCCTSSLNPPSKIKLTLGYLWAIVASIVLLAAVHSLSAGGPGGAAIIGYVMVFGYCILRWNLVAGKLVIKKWASVLLTIFFLICAFIVFAGVSGFHGGSEQGKMLAAVIALAMAIEAGWQIKRLSTLTSRQ